MSVEEIPNALKEILEKDLIEKKIFIVFINYEGLIRIIFSLILIFIMKSFNSSYNFILK